MNTARKFFCMAWMAILATGAMAQSDTPAVSAVQPATVLDDATQSQREAAEHARIDAARADKEAQTARAEAACYARFAVNDCLIKVRAERRIVLADLRRQEISLNDAARKRRAAQQLLRSDERSSNAAP